MDIGKVGAFCFLDAMTAGDSAAFCRRIERLGYKVLWTWSYPIEVSHR
jgi:hypothetical protein